MSSSQGEITEGPIEFEVDHERDLPEGYFFFVRGPRFNSSDDGEKKAEAMAAKLNAQQRDVQRLKVAMMATAAVLENLMESFKAVADVSKQARENKIIRSATEAESFLEA